MTTRIRRHRGGVRIEQHGWVLTELPYRPGPTHSIFDVLAVATHLYACGPRIAVLGFAGGGMVAPLRKLGGGQVVHGVDLEEEGYRVFESVAREWGGEVAFERDDALAWMRRQRGRFDGIVEDLSVPQDGEVVKPEVSWSGLPPVIRRSVKTRGVVVSNLLPTPGMRWGELIAACRVGSGVVVGFTNFYNRVLIQGEGVGSAREAGERIRGALRTLGSDLAGEIFVRSLVD